MDPFLLAAIEEAEAGLSEGGITIGSVLVHEGRILEVRSREDGLVELGVAEDCAREIRAREIPLLEVGAHEDRLAHVNAFRERLIDIDIEKHRVRLQNYFPVARFGASFYINTRERYALGENGSGNEAPRSTAIDEI